MDEEAKRRLSQCIELWNSAERAIKEAELTQRRLTAPSVNELRYAGRWLVLAFEAVIKGNDRIDALTSVHDAFGYASLCCMQAKHDAIDSIVLFLHEKIDRIAEQYSHKILATYIDGYFDFLANVEKVDAFIVMSRQERHNRLTIYDDVTKNHVPAIRDFLLKVTRAEIAMNEELDQEKQKIATEDHERRRTKKLFWASLALNVVLALAGIVVSIVFAIH